MGDNTNSDETTSSLSSTVLKPFPSLRKISAPAIPRININVHGFELRDNAGVLEPGSPSRKKRLGMNRKESEHLALWIKMTKNWEGMIKRPGKIKAMVRRGIPDQLRGVVWYSLTNAEESRIKLPTLFQELKTKELSESVDDQIVKDLDRTFPRNVYFKDSASGQKAMYNVLKCLGLYFPEVGYIQGMSFIAATLLMYLGEEESFWIMFQLMKGKFNLNDMFKEGLPLLNQRTFIFEHLIKSICPKIHKHFESEGFSPQIYAHKWFITIFISSAPFNISLRVFDVFLSEGFKVVYRVGLAILIIGKKRLLKASHDDLITVLDEVLLELSKNPSQLIKGAFDGVQLSRKTINSLERKWKKHLEDSN